MSNLKKDNGFHHSMSEYYPVKAAFEDVFGRDEWYKLKETANLNDWKKETNKLLSAIQTASKQTVRVVDDEFHKELDGIIELGRTLLKHSINAADLFSTLSSILIRITFLQIGFEPSFGGKSKSLKHKNWNLSSVRSVQYVQTKEQKMTSKEIKELGYALYSGNHYQ